MYNINVFRCETKARGKDSIVPGKQKEKKVCSGGGLKEVSRKSLEKT